MPPSPYRRARALLALAAALLAAALTAPAALAAGPVISTGQLHTCAVQSDGNPVCWGTNNNGVVSGAAGKGPLKAISANEGHTCGLEVDGDASCWGDDFYNQVSGPASGGPYLAIAAGANYTCAIKRADRSLACWGENPPYYVSKPNGMPTTGAYEALSAGASHACAIRTDDTPVCWGDDYAGQVSGAPTTAVKSIFAGPGAATCAVMADDTARCWGSNSNNQTDIPSDLGTIKQIGLTAEVACAIRADDTVRCWGNNANGLLYLPSDLGPVTELSTGSYQACAVKAASKQPKCWGYDGGEGRVTGAEGKGPIGPHRPVAGGRTAISAPSWSTGVAVAGEPGPFANAANFTTYGYQWQSCTGSPLTCSDLPGATESTYTPTVADRGSRVRLYAKATNPFGAARASSPVGGVIGLPVRDSEDRPTIVGTPKQGTALSATTGGWGNQPTAYDYEWERCSGTPVVCQPISSTDASDDEDYTPTSSDVGTRIRVRVTGRNDVGEARAVSIRAPTVM